MTRSDKEAINHYRNFALKWSNQTPNTMMQAIWNSEVIAESDDTVIVEGNHYFPNDSVKKEFLEPSETSSYCGWKGDCNYYSLKVGDQTNPDAVWYYGDPFPKAEHIRGRMAFWKGVIVREK